MTSRMTPVTATRETATMQRKPRHSASLHDADLVAALWQRDVPYAETFLSAFASVVTEALAAGQEVRLHFFGVLRVREYPAITGRNPRTGRTIRFPAHRKVIFRVSRILLDAINRRRRRRRLGHG